MKRTKTEYVTSGIAGLELISSTGSRVEITPHTHVSTYTILLVRSGKIRLATARGVCSLHAGSCIPLPPHFLHSLRAVSKYSLLSLSVDVSLIGKTPSVAGFLDCLVGSGHVSPVEKECITTALKDVVPESESPDDAVESLKKEIITLPEQEISLADMAERVHLDKFHFIRVFRKRYGLPPHSFLMQNRIRKARKRLSPDGSMTRAALDAGFYDQSHFIRYFKRLHGLTPRQYVKSQGRVRLAEF